MIKHGVGHEKSDVLNFPEWLDESLYSYFIAGLFDGDGSVSYNVRKSKLRCNLISTKEVLDFINEFFEKKFKWVPCKICKITENKNNVYKGFWYKHAFDFLDYIYQSIHSLNQKNLY